MHDLAKYAAAPLCPGGTQGRRFVKAPPRGREGACIHQWKGWGLGKVKICLSHTRQVMLADQLDDDIPTLEIALAREILDDVGITTVLEPGKNTIRRAITRSSGIQSSFQRLSIANLCLSEGFIPLIVMQEGQIALSGPRQAVLEKLAAMRHQQEQAAQARVQQEKLARQQALQKQQEALQKTQEAGGNA